MAYIESGSNLNVHGDQGRFEADRSTWGFSDNASLYVCTRSTVPSPAPFPPQGLYVCKMAIPQIIFPRSLMTFAPLGLISAPIIGKRYRAKCKIRAKGDDLPFGLTAIFAITPGSNYSSNSSTTKTRAEATDTFVELSVDATYNGGFFTGNVFKISVTQSVLGVIAGTPGTLYIDEFHIFELIEEQPPVCDFAINVPACVVTNETATDADDGTITMAVTGGTAPIEYSKDNINWQTSNQFTGLAPGSYTIYVRESSALACTAQQVFNIDAYGVAFDFTAAVTDESIAGAEDGQIDITVTGSGAPFTYSKDNGGTYQSSNVFTGLAPGNYVIVVKDSGDATKAKTVTVGAGTVVFDKIYFSKNPIEYKRFSTSANYNKDNYKIHIDAQYEAIPDSGNFSHLMYASKAPLSVLTANQPVSFNIAPAFRGLFTPNPPEKNAAAILRLTDRIKFYKINYGDIYEQLESPASTTPSNPFLVMYGGLSKKKYSEIDYFYNYLPTNKKFMTWAPLVKDVDYNQEDYLQFWCYDLAVSTAKLMIKAYFDDDTNETDQITSLKVTYGHLLQIPAGPLNSGAIGINPAKNLKYYDLWLADQNDAVISEVRTYKITEFKHPRTRYYLFLNSLGGYEVLRTVGFSEQSIEISREVIERFYGFGTYTTFGQYMAGEATKRKGTEVSSGFFSGSLSKKWLDYMQEPAMSRFVFDITDGTRVPLINMTKEAIIARNEDNKRFVRFEFLDAFADQSYTPYDIA
jgi:hypothetical protein